MRPRFLPISILLIVCATISGCLLNVVHPIKHAIPERSDSNHAIVVLGVGLDVPWPHTEFPLIFDEYSLKKQNITGNCFLYTRIEVRRPSALAPVSYFAFEVPASAYVYSQRNANAQLPPAPNATGFIAPAGKAVYIGDYVFVGNESVELRHNVEAARDATRRLLPRGAVLEAATAITPPHGHGFLCTP
jgi:hypothetical protein